MEGSNWIRIGAIVALLLGAIYILLPTILQEDLESRLERQASTVEAPASRGIDLDVVFDVREGDPAAIAEVLSARIQQRGVPVVRVTPGADTVTVTLDAGGSRDEVARLAGQPGHAVLADPRALPGADGVEPQTPEDPAERGLWPNIADALSDAGVDARPFAGPLRDVGLQPLDIEGAQPLDAARVTVSDEGRVVVERGPLPEGWPFAVVVVDGQARGVLIPDGDALRYEPFGDPDSTVVALLASPALEGALALRTQEEAAPAEAAAPTEAPTAGSGAPEWLVRLLPDTRMNLGLDLQGGIDLTLQVGLQDAVLAQASRDLAYARDQASREGLTFESVRRERALPVVWFTTDAPLADVQAFVRKSMSDYIYRESDGNRHAFEMRSDRADEIQEQAVEQVLETLRKRVDATGVKEPTIVKKGGGQINVQLPGEVDLQEAIDALGTTAILEFRMVDAEFDPSVLERIIAAARDQMPPEQYADDALLNDWLWTTQRLDEDRIVMWEYEETPDGPVRSFPHPLMIDAVLTGNDVGNAGVAWDQNQQAYVSLEFKPRGGRIFCDVTTANVGKPFAIVLDGVVQSTPNIRERICGGSARIDMGGAVDPLREAQMLSLVLRTGSLDAPVDLGGVRQVGATLGQDSIRKGGIAAAIGGGIVMLFMALWYRRSGLIANVALVLNVLLVLSALALFGATLTLPGIAGIALTVGMAVDANIIIFERIREELRLGVHPRKAVDVGFDKALVAVLDANITTAIAGVVLFSYGTGPIKGFAVTLLIGIVTTLVTALFVTRTLMEVSTRSSTARLKL